MLSRRPGGVGATLVREAPFQQKVHKIHVSKRIHFPVFSDCFLLFFKLQFHQSSLLPLEKCSLWQMPSLAPSSTKAAAGGEGSSVDSSSKGRPNNSIVFQSAITAAAAAADDANAIQSHRPMAIMDANSRSSGLVSAHSGGSGGEVPNAEDASVFRFFMNANANSESGKKRSINENDTVPTTNNNNNPTNTTCKCSKSRCIKLYCDCFHGGNLCNSLCNCTDCKNTTEFREEREWKMKEVLKLNPKAFSEDSDKFNTKRQRMSRGNGCACPSSQ